jgi:hypothetical protein
MNLYKSSQVYTSIARLIIKPNFMFTVDSFIKPTEFELIYRSNLLNRLVHLQSFLFRAFTADRVYFNLKYLTKTHFI